MRLNNMVVTECQGGCRIYTPQGIPVADIYLPPDGQAMMNYKCVEILCKALAVRWGVLDLKKKSSY